MGKLITFADGKKVEERGIPDPVEPDIDAEIADLKARITALENSRKK